MSAEPLTPDEVREWSTLALREHTEGVQWAVLDRMIATLQAGEAERDQWAHEYDLCAADRDALARRVEALWLVIDYAMHLRVNGERAPGGDETWGQWEQMVRAADDAARGER